MLHRLLTSPVVWFVLGAATFYAGMASSVGLQGLGLALVALAVAAGLVEAASVRRTGRHRRVGTWLPAVLGMATLAAVEMATGPQGADSGVALSIVAAAFVVLTPVFALVVLGFAALALRVGRRRTVG